MSPLMTELYQTVAYFLTKTSPTIALMLIIDKVYLKYSLELSNLLQLLVLDHIKATCVYAL